MKHYVRELTPEEVSKRIQARFAAETIASLADEEAEKYGKVVWEQLHKICAAHTPCQREVKVPNLAYQPMTDDEAKAFGKMLMPFGEFAQQPVDEVPLDRLDWYADQTFTDQLRRYLRSRRIQVEKDDEL